MEQIQSLDITSIFEPADAHRDSIDMMKVRELAEDIRDKGQLQPILVRPVNGKYEVVAGHRRYLAHLIIEALHINAIVRDLSDEDVILIRASENLQREDLTPIEEAKVYARLRDVLKMSIESISRKMNRHSQTIRRYLDLLELPPEFQTAIDNGSLNIGVADILKEIDSPDLMRYYLENAVKHGCSVKTAQLWLQDYQSTKAAQFYMSPASADGMAILPQAKPIYYTCDCCFGSVEISRIKHLAACPDCVLKVRAKILV